MLFKVKTPQYTVSFNCYCDTRTRLEVVNCVVACDSDYNRILDDSLLAMVEFTEYLVNKYWLKAQYAKKETVKSTDHCNFYRYIVEYIHPTHE